MNGAQGDRVCFHCRERESMWAGTSLWGTRMGMTNHGGLGTVKMTKGLTVHGVVATDHSYSIRVANNTPRTWYQ